MAEEEVKKEQQGARLPVDDQAFAVVINRSRQLTKARLHNPATTPAAPPAFLRLERLCKPAAPDKPGQRGVPWALQHAKLTQIRNLEYQSAPASTASRRPIQQYSQEAGLQSERRPRRSHSWSTGQNPLQHAAAATTLEWLGH